MSTRPLTSAMRIALETAWRNDGRVRSRSSSSIARFTCHHQTGKGLVARKLMMKVTHKPLEEEDRRTIFFELTLTGWQLANETFAKGSRGR